MNGEWLFQNHLLHTGKLRVFEKQLQSLAECPAASCENEWIESLSLAKSWQDGMPHASNPSSSTSTERTAFAYDALARKELSNCREELQIRANAYRKYLHLYESTLLILTEDERWIVQTHYIEGKALADMIAMLPTAMGITSRSGLIRRKNRLLAKVDAFLQEFTN
jgi:hypothetical protein